VVRLATQQEFLATQLQPTLDAAVAGTGHVFFVDAARPPKFGRFDCEDALAKHNLVPHRFFIGAAIEPKMANEIWGMLESGVLENAANLTNDEQIASLSRWLCAL